MRVCARGRATDDCVKFSDTDEWDDAGSPEELRTRLAADLVKWDAVIKHTGIQPL